MAKGGDDVARWVVKTLVSVLIVGAILPTIMVSLNAMENDTVNFSAPEIAIISVIGILLVIGFFYKLMKSSGVGN